MKKWFFISIALLVVFTLIGAIAYKMRINALSTEKNATIEAYEAKNEVLSAATENYDEVSSLAYRYIMNHTIERLENLDIYVPLEIEDAQTYTQEERWLIQHERALSNQDIDMWLQLFNSSYVSEWLQSLTMDDVPEKVALREMMRGYEQVESITYFEQESMPYMRISYRDEQTYELPFLALNEGIQLEITLAEWFALLKNSGNNSLETGTYLNNNN